MCAYVHVCVVGGEICVHVYVCGKCRYIRVCTVCVCVWEGGVGEEIGSYVCNVSLITAN